MALGAQPSRNEIWIELEESNFRNGGVNNNHLQDMYAYVFDDGSGHYSRNEFTFEGLASISNLSLTAGDGQIDCEFLVQEIAPNKSITIYAQYWDESEYNEPPVPYDTQEIGTVSSETYHNRTITGLTNDVNYGVRLFAINKFNNAKNFPDPVSSDPNYPATNKQTAMPERPEYSPPAIQNTAIQENNFSMYLDISHPTGDQDSIETEYRFNSGTANRQTESQYHCGADLDGQSPEIILGMNQAPTLGDTVEARVRAVGSSLDPSPWSMWTECTFESSVPTCPLELFPPENVTVTQIDAGTGEVEVTWDSPSEHGDVNTNIDWWEVNSWTNTDSTTHNYNDGETAQARVRYNTSNDTTSWSESNQITVTISVQEPPQNFSGVSDAQNCKVDLTWDHPTTGAPDGYEIHYSENDGPWNVVSNNISGFDTSISHTGATSGNTYDYRIRAVDNSGIKSDWVPSGEVSLICFG